ncbi:MCE family protein [Mycobacteroides abscessus]|uniref:MCE family protein n=1 Tax=Mycobacteroides abscessus TaxID=36809 RepID=UPI000241D55C|nr:MCE family protein [Mycobacteroides abscessus]EHM14968.1 virulence factor Mce family protein [Mycobacteroides abscessus subsp. bolletii BD]ORA30884.1 mammalian cell entry protein [Mycobacteroides abscessus subsp. bolletii]TPF67658.1 mammalian cell entry protein [Mycobacteroides abscessus subsp. bolletii]BBB43926.1 mammalian cell entry protein [Mycobacteroides abscessus subsp. bolletii BD]
MDRYRKSSLVRTGLIGTIVIVLVIAVGLNTQELRSMLTSVRHQALFREAGGLTVGNAVKVSGVKVGTVSDVVLHQGDALVTFTVESDVQLGSQTTAHIRTGTLLGERVLTLQPAGPGTLRPRDVIPVSRTSSPYSLTDAVDDFTTNTTNTNTAAINQSLDALSDTIDRVAPQLGPLFAGLSHLSRSLNDRNDSLHALLKSAADVTGTLAQRGAQINTLILNANDLAGMLEQRRYAIVNLLANTSALAQQISAVIHDNENKLRPVLTKLNSVLQMLEKNHDNIAQALSGLAKYQVTQGESVNNGFFYNAFVGNLLPGPAIQPFLDYAFGFRRGSGAGQPPDSAGPRSEFPFPYNGIPGGN